MAGIVPELLDLKYLYVEVSSKIYYNTNLAPSSTFVSSIVQNNVNKYAESTELNKYGARLKYSKLLKLIDDGHDSITSNITTIAIRRDLRLTLDTFVEYQIGFGNQFHIKSMSGYNIKSSGFTVAGIQEVVYVSDIPDTNRRTGTLFFFTLPTPGSQSPNIVRRYTGFINYDSGVITINPVNITGAKTKDGQPILELSAIPHSNDVIGLQDLYLQLDTSSSLFEPVVDDVSSGLDPSSSTYIVSSSYSNGNLVRSGGPDTATGTRASGSRVTAQTSGVTGGTRTSISTSGASTGSTGSTGSSGGSTGGSGGGSGY